MKSDIITTKQNGYLLHYENNSNTHNNYDFLRSRARCFYKQNKYIIYL